MNMREYVDRIINLEGEAENADIDLTKVQVVGYLVGPGIIMKPLSPFIDAKTLHLDYEMVEEEAQTLLSRTVDRLRDMEEAHAQGLHDESPREFCPMCERR
jgi:hypothetical protein